jgi:hypothetical protein
MRRAKEQRKERRMYYDWPIRFFEDFRGLHFPGRTVDISSEGMAFLCHADKNCPELGQQITARFSVPRFGSDGRINQVAIQFAKPLFFKPGEQGVSETAVQEKLEAVTV